MLSSRHGHRSIVLRDKSVFKKKCNLLLIIDLASNDNYFSLFQGSTVYHIGGWGKFPIEKFNPSKLEQKNSTLVLENYNVWPEIFDVPKFFCDRKIKFL